MKADLWKCNNISVVEINMHLFQRNASTTELHLTLNFVKQLTKDFIQNAVASHSG
jgi:hypothetical protein